MSSQPKLLNPDKLLHAIPSEGQLHYFDKIDSTNDFLKQSALSAVEVCLCEQQLAGRGRFGRDWLSPYGENIYCSIKYPLPIDDISSLSLRLGIVLAEFCQQLLSGHEVKLKWPNDILVDDYKIAGILIELVGDAHKLHHAVIGFGINVNMRDALLSNQWSSLSKITGHHFDRTAILENLLRRIFDNIENESSLDTDKWQQYDYLLGKTVKVTCSGTPITGEVLGVTAEGGLQLVLESGQKHVVYAGEATLHEG